MARMPKTTAQSKKLVWRISPAAPQGEWVDPAAVAPAAPPAPPKLAEPEVSSGSWVTSSFDLLNGTDVVESQVGSDSALFDALFAPSPPAPDRGRK